MECQNHCPILKQHKNFVLRHILILVLQEQTHELQKITSHIRWLQVSINGGPTKWDSWDPQTTLDHVSTSLSPTSSYHCSPLSLLPLPLSHSFSTIFFFFWSFSTISLSVTLSLSLTAMSDTTEPPAPPPPSPPPPPHLYVHPRREPFEHGLIPIPKLIFTDGTQTLAPLKQKLLLRSTQTHSQTNRVDPAAVAETLQISPDHARLVLDTLAAVLCSDRDDVESVGADVDDLILFLYIQSYKRLLPRTHKDSAAVTDVWPSTSAFDGYLSALSPLQVVNYRFYSTMLSISWWIVWDGLNLRGGCTWSLLIGIFGWLYAFQLEHLRPYSYSFKNLSKIFICNETLKASLMASLYIWVGKQPCKIWVSPVPWFEYKFE